MQLFMLIKTSYNFGGSNPKISDNNHETKVLLFSRDYAKILEAYQIEKIKLTEFVKSTYQSYRESCKRTEVVGVDAPDAILFIANNTEATHIILEITAITIPEIFSANEEFHRGDIVRLKESGKATFCKCMGLSDESNTAIYLGQVLEADNKEKKIKIRGLLSHLGNPNQIAYLGKECTMPSDIYTKVVWWK